MHTGEIVVISILGAVAAVVVVSGIVFVVKYRKKFQTLPVTTPPTIPKIESVNDLVYCRAA
jgi:heme/copper-type cytochrome/quinol oxidase subunit 2